MKLNIIIDIPVIYQETGNLIVNNIQVLLMHVIDNHNLDKNPRIKAITTELLRLAISSTFSIHTGIDSDPTGHRIYPVHW